MKPTQRLARIRGSKAMKVLRSMTIGANIGTAILCAHIIYKLIGD